MNSLTTKNPVVGTKLTPAIIRAINTEIRRNQPIAGQGIRVSRTLGGTKIDCTVKANSGGGASSQLLYPYKCVYSEFEGSGSSDVGSSGGSGAYLFYLPFIGSGGFTLGSDTSEAVIAPCLNLNGNGVKFSPINTYGPAKPEGAAEGPPKFWMQFSDFEFGSDAGTETKLIVCDISRESGSGGEYRATMKTLEQYVGSGSDTQGFVGTPLVFPVCVIQQTTSDKEVTDSGGSTKIVKEVSRTIHQLAFGEQHIDDVDNQPFKLDRVDGSWKVVNNIYRLENIVRMMEDQTLESSWAGKYVFLISGSSNLDMNYVAGTLSDLQNACADPMRAVIPLYKFTDFDSGSPATFKVECDLRALPTAQMWMAAVDLGEAYNP